MHIMSQEYNSKNDSNSATRHSLHYEYEQDHRANLINFEKSMYESAPVARNTIENNQVRIINYRGTKLTSFNVDGRQLICLPQAFDFFLKNFVGGLHTVYTKLKRLEIIPIVCNVEQVRILRGLGAIQPGVNRCKLLAPNEFDVLYEDCTNSGSRPGRPPKRNSAHQLDNCSDNKRMKFSTDLLLRSFSDFKYPVHSNGYLSNPITNGNHLSSFNYSAFTPTLPLHLTHSYLSNDTQPATTSHRSISSNESRPFTIDAMLNNEKNDNRDRLTKPIDLSMTAIEQTSSILPTQQTTTAAAGGGGGGFSFFHIKNIIELTVENARLREKQLENEITGLRSEITKEQDCKQKLEEDFLQLRRVRNILIKKLKRINQSSGCSNNKNLLETKSC